MLPVVAKPRLPTIASRFRAKREPLSQQDYELIKANLKRYDTLLLAKVLRCTGLREAEVMRLTPELIVSEGPYTYILTIRGKKKLKEWERVPLHPEVATELVAYARRGGIKPGSPVFTCSKSTFQKHFRGAARLALGRDAHPHQLRKLYATDLINQGLPIAAASKLLGHEDVNTTLEWYYDLTQEQRHAINAKTRP